MRFSLRTLLVVMTLAAGCCALIGEVTPIRGQTCRGVFIYPRWPRLHGVDSLGIYRWRGGRFVWSARTGPYLYALVVESDGAVWVQWPDGYGGPARRRIYK